MLWKTPIFYKYITFEEYVSKEFLKFCIFFSLQLEKIDEYFLTGKEKRNTVWFFSTALFLERLDATGTPGTQGGVLIYTPALGRAMCPPGIGQSAGTLICMHLLGRGWRQIRASACAVLLFTETVYQRPRHLLGTGCTQKAIPGSHKIANFPMSQ